MLRQRRVRRSGTQGLVRAGAIASAVIVSSAFTTSSLAFRSDPIRNLFPEEPACRETIQNPAYAPLPSGSLGEVDHVPPEALLHEFLSKHTSMNYPGAVEAAMRLVAAVPDRPAGHYNLACALARMQRMDEAFAALMQAIENGWRDRIHTAVDPDLVSLRKDPRFEIALNEMLKKTEAERITPCAPRVDPWQSVVGDLTRQAPVLLERHHVPGAVLALVDNGEVVWTAAFGFRDSRSDRPMQVEDRFRLRAPLHLFAITSGQVLQEHAKLDLADLIVQAANDAAVATLTRSGTRRDGAQSGEPVGQAAARRDRPNAGSDRVSHTRVHAVRSGLRNYGRHSVYGHLRLAVEAASGQTFIRFCEDLIIQPLALRATDFAIPDGEDILVSGHSVLGSRLTPDAFQSEFAPGGCVYMTAGDLARVIAVAMARNPRITPGPGIGDDPHLEAPLAASMHSAIELVTQADDALSGVLGLALHRNDGPHGLRLQLDESAAGIVCLARWHPQTGRGLVILCNSATAKPAADQLAHLALGGD